MVERYNKLYNKDFSITYIACPIDCSVCEIWKKPANIWKFFEFFPYHCTNCLYAGYPDDFYLFNNRAFMCLPCYSKANKELQKRFFYWKYKKLN